MRFFRTSSRQRENWVFRIHSARNPYYSSKEPAEHEYEKSQLDILDDWFVGIVGARCRFGARRSWAWISRSPWSRPQAWSFQSRHQYRRIQLRFLRPRLLSLRFLCFPWILLRPASLPVLTQPGGIGNAACLYSTRTTQRSSTASRLLALLPES